MPEQSEQDVIEAEGVRGLNLATIDSHYVLVRIKWDNICATGYKWCVVILCSHRLLHAKIYIYSHTDTPPITASTLHTSLSQLAGVSICKRQTVVEKRGWEECALMCSMFSILKQLQITLYLRVLSVSEQVASSDVLWGHFFLNLMSCWFNWWPVFIQGH